jgi:quinol monooxygenase YgiN
MGALLVHRRSTSSLHGRCKSRSNRGSAVKAHSIAYPCTPTVENPATIARARQRLQRSCGGDAIAPALPLGHAPCAMLIIHVDIHVKPEGVEAFRRATLENAAASLEEAGVVRFDFAQALDDPAHFVLLEVYRDDQAPARHKETAHYAKWRDAVAELMASPRTSVKYRAEFPEPERWETARERR